MSTTMAPPAPGAEPQASMGAFARIFGVFFSPGTTFADIVGKPSWVAPIVLLTLFSLSVSASMNQRVDWREVASQRIEKSGRVRGASRRTRCL